ncbi:MAG: ribokinase [Frankiaceae bacterium]|nr:ribokinase [Frankiaceae bacterium]
MSADVLVLGSLNVDLVMRVPRIPQVGETVADGRFARRRGGKGANQAVAAARLGARVRMVGGVGADDEGRYALAGLVAEGVDTSLVEVVPDQPTGTALILVDDAGDNLIAVASGANACIAVSAGFADVLASGPGVLLASLEVPVDVVLSVAAMALDAGWAVVVNPAPAPPPGTSWPAGAVLTPNQSELQSMTGEGDVETAVRQLATDSGCRIVATLGAEGVLLCTGDTVERVAGVPVQCVDTTGAGDAFNGALAMGLAAGLSLTEAVRQANAAAAYSTETAGAQEGLLTLAQLQSRSRG